MDNTGYLEHHGVNKQKWGIRRFQYEDGGLTPAGKEHYRKGKPSTDKKFDTDRYSHKDGSLTYMGNQKFSKSEKFNEMRNKRKNSGGVRHAGLSLIQASVLSSGQKTFDGVLKNIQSSSINDESIENLTVSGVNSVSALFDGPSMI